MTRKEQIKTAPPALRQAMTQFGPVARNAGRTAGRTAADRVQGARAWAAPQLDRAAFTIRESVAPKVSAMLAATAQRVEPMPQQLGDLSRGTRRQIQRARRAAQKAADTTTSELTARRAKLNAREARSGRTRWPKVVGLVMFLSAAAGAAAFVATRRAREAAEAELAEACAEEETPDQARSLGGAEVGFDGQVRTP
jgi:hypothetical protein